MIIRKAELETVCGITSTLPESLLPEFAFAGKSNVGKSSLINGLLNRRALARTSSQPGKTQTINFYNVNDSLYFVDLPGYGYAKVARSEKERWARLMETYFQREADAITTGVLIVDIRHMPTANDLVMHDWFRQTGCPEIVVANKLDKLKKSQLAKTQEDFENICRPYGCQKVVLTSGENGYGIPELQAVLNAAVAAEDQEAE